MDKKTKTFLIVAALAVGGYLLYRRARTKGGTILNKEELGEDGKPLVVEPKQAARS
jgi:hypothetical protein